MSSGILNKKANLILAQLTGVSLFLSGLIGLAVLKFYKYFTFIIKSLLGNIQTVCGCQAPVSFANHPYVITGLFILAIGLLTAILSFIVKAVSIYYKTKRFIKKYIKHDQINSTKLNHITQQINLNGKVIEIQTEEPMVFCYGFINPRICISSAIVNSLSGNELKAVLLHEQHHLKVYEPIKLLLVKIISNALFFIPGIKSLTKQYAVFSELAADETATDNFKNKVPLAQALNKILAQKENMLIQKGLAISFFSEIIEERVNKLVDNNYIPRLKFGFVKMFSSLAVFGVLALSAKFLYPSYNQFLPAVNEGGNCVMNEQIKSNERVYSPLGPACRQAGGGGLKARGGLAYLPLSKREREGVAEVLDSHSPYPLSGRGGYWRPTHPCLPAGRPTPPACRQAGPSGEWQSLQLK